MKNSYKFFEVIDTKEIYPIFNDKVFIYLTGELLPVKTLQSFCNDHYFKYKIITKKLKKSRSWISRIKEILFE